MPFELESWRQGRSTDGFRYFGCHMEQYETVFRLWAPGARAVSVAGPFTGWQSGIYQAREIEPGVFECRTAGLYEYIPYKFVITAEDGRQFFKSDPFAFHAETPPGNASKLYDPFRYEWSDAKWMGKRCAEGQPLSIYQIHAGSFRTYAGGEPLNYRKLGEELTPYLKTLGCTHLGLMPLLEHMREDLPRCGTTGFFALTSRYGVPRDFCRMVEQLHLADIGVTMDVDLLGFPFDDFGLSEFTGQPYWESETGPDGCYFDLEKPAVRSFLLSSAAFLLEVFHLDGLRLLRASEIAARPGGAGFLRDFIRTLREKFPAVLFIGDAEGFGFSRVSSSGDIRTLLRLAMGEDLPLPAPRAGLLQQIDLDVTGRETLITRMPGSYEEKFARLRAIIACYRALPGAKFSFMGNEFAQFSVWSPDRELDWVLLDYEMHRKFLAMVCRTSDFYRKTAAIWEESDFPARYELIDPAGHPGVRGFIRRDEAGSQIIVLCNFTRQPVSPFVLGVDKRGKYAELFSSDEIQYGGEGRSCNVNFAKLRPAGGKPYCIEAELPPLTTVYLYKSAGTPPAKRRKS